MSEVVLKARTYYNSTDADEFYARVWGGEDIHIGMYKSKEDSIFDASRQTVATMASLVKLDASRKVLDIGSGYGGAARYLAKSFGCTVDCLNLSESQNSRNRQLTQSQGLDQQIHIFEGNFEQIPFGNNSYDLVWSQDAIVHSGNRVKVVQEVYRILKKGGEFLFTDIMQRDDCPNDVLQPIFDRIHLNSMGSIGFYKKTAEDLGLKEVQIIEHSQQLVNHYSQVLKELESKYEELVTICTTDYLESQKRGLRQWIDAGQKGYITWGILQFKK